MRGLIRPCRHHLDADLFAQWQAHLCGLCLGLRDSAGQAARFLTGYDTLLPSVLVEAQTSYIEGDTRTAGPCALRGFNATTVLRNDSPAIRLATASALSIGSSTLDDKIADADLPTGTAVGARVAVRMLARRGAESAGRIGLPLDSVKSATTDSLSLEADLDATLAEILAPSGAVAGEVFAHSATVAGRPENIGAMKDLGDNYGRLVHLLDVVEDRTNDIAKSKYNPLVATDTADDEARFMANSLFDSVNRSLGAATLIRPTLATTLFGTELQRTLAMAFGDKKKRKKRHGGLCRREPTRREKAKDRVADVLDDLACNCCSCDCCDCCNCWDCSP